MLLSPRGALREGLEIIQPRRAARPAAAPPAVPVQAAAPFPEGLGDPSSECPVVSPNLFWGRRSQPRRCCPGTPGQGEQRALGNLSQPAAGAEKWVCAPLGSTPLLHLPPILLVSGGG